MSAQQTLMSKYGIPNALYQEKFCMIWDVKKDFAWFPTEKFLVNIEFRNKLFAAFTALENAGLHTEIKTFNGCYNERSVRGRCVLSLHGWACAIDLNADTEKLGQTKAGWSSSFLAIMKAKGIYWGGDFINRKDPMHFALLDG